MIVLVIITTKIGWKEGGLFCRCVRREGGKRGKEKGGKGGGGR
jgi:hypothetical protein